MKNTLVIKFTRPDNEPEDPRCEACGAIGAHFCHGKHTSNEPDTYPEKKETKKEWEKL